MEEESVSLVFLIKTTRWGWRERVSRFDALKWDHITGEDGKRVNRSDALKWDHLTGEGGERERERICLVFLMRPPDRWRGYSKCKVSNTKEVVLFIWYFLVIHVALSVHPCGTICSSMWLYLFIHVALSIHLCGAICSSIYHYLFIHVALSVHPFDTVCSSMWHCLFIHVPPSHRLFIHVALPIHPCGTLVFIHVLPSIHPCGTLCQVNIKVRLSDSNIARITPDEQ